MDFLLIAKFWSSPNNLYPSSIWLELKIGDDKCEMINNNDDNNSTLDAMHSASSSSKVEVAVLADHLHKEQLSGATSTISPLIYGGDLSTGGTSMQMRSELRVHSAHYYPYYYCLVLLRRKILIVELTA